MRKGGEVVIAGDGQVSFGQTVLKSNARKVRTLADGSVIVGFAGATASSARAANPDPALRRVATFGFASPSCRSSKPRRPRT